MQGKFEADLIASRIIPVSHPAAGLVSRDYVEEGEEFIDLHAMKAEKERKAKEEEEKKLAAAAAAAAQESEVVEDVDAFLKSLEGGGL